jgi:superfamily II DNA or RNA helicase
MDLDRVLTTKGYSIRKGALSPKEAAALQEELLVTPKMNTKFVGKAAIAAASFKVYRESPQRFYVPRSWGIAKFGPPQASVVPEGSAMPAASAKFVGSPYPYQEDIISTFVKAGANGLICVPCGKGKTFMALAIAARLGKRFLVVVDKEFLMNQWRGEMQALMPGLRVGIVQGPKREIDPAAYDCTICMIQSVCGQDFADSTFQDYGFTIFDECHHLGAQHFSKTLQKIQTRWMLGLSATPTREDGLTKVFTWFLGEPVYWEKTREPDPTVEVKHVFIKTTDTVYNDVPVDWRGEVVMARMLGNVLGCAERTAEIVRWIRVLLAEPLRKILVLSERIGHLNTIEDELKKLEPAASTPSGSASHAGVTRSATTAYYIGGMKEAVREEGAATARVLLASYAMASEAMNIKSLNAVILASPRKSVEQSTGRILRVRPDQRQVQPVIVDIVDTHQMYVGQWRKRLAYYKRCAYQNETWDMGATEGRRMRGAAAAADQVEATQVDSAAAGAAGGCMIADDD